MNVLFTSLTQPGLTGERHLHGLAPWEQTSLRQAVRMGIITVGAYKGTDVQPLEWWDSRGLNIFRNHTDGGWVRVNLTSLGWKLFSKNYN